MWRLGFFFHDMAFGLLTVFIPLYRSSVQEHQHLGRSASCLGRNDFNRDFLLDSRLVSLGIPLRCYPSLQNLHSSFLRLDSHDSFPHDVSLRPEPDCLCGLYVAMQMLHVAHESPKNVLVTEHYSRSNWERTFGLRGHNRNRHHRRFSNGDSSVCVLP